MMGQIQTCHSSCINLLSWGGGGPRNKSPPSWPRTVKWLWRLRPKTGGNYTRGGGKKKTCWQKWSTANYLSVFTKHRLIWGSDTNFPKGNAPPPPLLCLLLNTTETCIYQVRTLMKDGFRSARLLPLDSFKIWIVQAHIFLLVLLTSSTRDSFAKTALKMCIFKKPSAML